MPARSTPPAGPATTADGSPGYRWSPPPDPPPPEGTPWSTPPPTPGRATTPPARPPPTRCAPPRDHPERRSPSRAITPAYRALTQGHWAVCPPERSGPAAQPPCDVDGR